MGERRWYIQMCNNHQHYYFSAYDIADILAEWESKETVRKPVTKGWGSQFFLSLYAWHLPYAVALG